MNVILFVFTLSQMYWGWQAHRWIGRRTRTRAVRLAFLALLLAVYFSMMAYNFQWFTRVPSPTTLTLGSVLLAAPFQWWVASSIVGFLLVAIGNLGKWLVRGLILACRRLTAPRPEPPASPERRLFLERTAVAAVASPFVAGSYGLLWGRLNLQTTEQTIRLKNLPKAFDGFRIAQLSDIHIGPFMPEQEIRKYVAIANSLKPDLTVLTGDYVTWDGETQEEVVAALSGLHAPFGVYGCLGNHDAWSHVEASITELFRHTGFRILRQERVDIATHGESFNLIGIDFQSLRRFGPGGTRIVRRFLEGLEPLVIPGRANLLLSHNPDTFNRAAELGVDFSMAGHTHGGQVALEFISPEIAPSRLVTPYVQGWFERGGSQLYVNRGIGTIGVPIRLGAPPEITVYKLTCA